MSHLLALVLAGAVGSGSATIVAPPSPLRLVQSIPLRGVEGRIDHMEVDLARRRLFLVAFGGNSLTIVDLATGRTIRTIGGFLEPQGVEFIPTLKRVFVSNGGDGTVEVLDGSSLGRLRRVGLSSDADNVRYDASAKRIYVGYGNGALGVLNATTGDSLGSIPLRAHPESFQLESKGPRIFVNVPDAGEVAVVDRAQGQVFAEWRLEGYAANFPMALDEAGHRLFVGCRRPAAVLVYDTQTGRRVAAVPVNGDVDDLYYDVRRGRLYASCGAGTLDVIAPEGTSGLARVASIPTARGARTALFVPELGRLYVAVPHRGRQRAEVRVFEAVR